MVCICQGLPGFDEYWTIICAKGASSEKLVAVKMLTFELAISFN